MEEDQLTRLVALSPGDGRVTGLVRRVCAQAVSLPPLPACVEVGEPESETEAVVAEFVPRVRAGLEALGVGSEYLGWVSGPISWDHTTEPSDLVFNDFMPAVGRLRALDPVTSEVVRLRGAAQHNCRLCKSLREATALDAGGSETLYDEIGDFEKSVLLTGRAKAALRYTDALIWTPAHLVADVVAEVRSRFSEAEAVELTFDIMRNGSNKVAVSLGGDAPRVEHGTERYLLDTDGQTVFS